MKRLIANILIFVLLTTQSAWAMFGGSLDADSGQVLLQVASSNVESGLNHEGEIDPDSHEHGDHSHNTKADACDHFCHGSIHLQGLFSYNRIIFQSTSAAFDSILVSLKLSLSEPPVNPPPIA